MIKFKKMSEMISKRIKYYLNLKGITQYKLEKLASIPHGTMQSILDAKRNGMNTQNLFNIINALDLTIIEFFDDEMFDLNKLSLE